jgi:hypothetical protein
MLHRSSTLKSLLSAATPPKPLGRFVQLVARMISAQFDFRLKCHPIRPPHAPNPQVMEEEDSSGVAWPHDLLLLRDLARSELRQLQAAEVYGAWVENVNAAMNATNQWPDLPKRASFGFCGTAHSLAAAGMQIHFIGIMILLSSFLTAAVRY